MKVTNKAGDISVTVEHEGEVPSCLSHGSLFSGIGGFDLAAQWMGWNNIFQVEKDDWCRMVLAKNFPNTERFADIKDFKGYEYRNQIDVLSAGLPCQPFSVAGQRRGKDDDRHLWPELLRVISEIKPAWVVAENVYGILTIEGGLVFEQACSDLEAEGYEVQPFVVPACAVNAPHRRDRVWIIAHTGGFRLQGRKQKLCPAQKQGYDAENMPASKLRERWKGNNLPAPRICRSYDGISDRVDRIKALGNAIVPQIAYELFKAIEGVHRSCHSMFPAMEADDKACNTA
jgi:DNA (cytosine-5)-methyltransferase 1